MLLHFSFACAASLAGKILDAPTCLQAVVTQSWLKHISLTVQSFDISVHLGVQHALPLQIGDIELMRVFLQHGYWKPEELCSLNHCCTFLHAFWLSDICTGAGDSIDSQIWYSHSPCQSIWNWPQKMPPLEADWRLWQLALCLALHLSHNNTLATPLGPWLHCSSPHGWYFETLTNQLWLVSTVFPVVTKSWFKYEKTYHLLFENLALNQKQK